MEDCAVTTETIGEVHYTYYSRDGIVVAECRKSTEYELNIECWYNVDGYHRVDGPAMIICRNGQIEREFWYRDGKRHRDDGPAEIWYDDGQKIRECWYRNGITYRIGQLASVVCRNIDSVVCYWDGTRYAQNIDEFRDAVKGDAIHEALRPLPIPIRDAIIPHYCYQ